MAAAIAPRKPRMTRELIAAALLLAGCKGQGGSPEATPSAVEAAAPAEAAPPAPPEEKTMTAAPAEPPAIPPANSSAISSTDGLPPELASATPLWESARAATGRQTARATRLYPDGRLYTFSDTRRGSKDGKPTRTPAPPAWRLDAKLDPAALAKIQALASGPFQALTAPAPSVGADGATITWRAWSSGREHVVITSAGATASLPAPIAEIEQTLQTGVVPGAVPLEQ
jgi:hypothetical protein